MGNERQPPLAEMQSEEQISVIGKRFTLQGDLSGEGMLIVYGRVDGNIRADGLIVNEGGSVSGEVHCQKIDLYGQIKGQVTASEVVIRRSGRLEGHVRYTLISVETGAEIVAQMMLNKGSEAEMAAISSGSVSALPKYVHFDLPPEIHSMLSGDGEAEGLRLVSVNGQPVPDWLVLDPVSRRMALEVARYRTAPPAFKVPLRLQFVCGERNFELVAPKLDDLH